MKRLILALVAISCGALCLPFSAQAQFGFKNFDFSFANADGSAATQAGSHPFAVTTTFNMNTKIDPEFGELPDGAIRDFNVELPVGQAGAPQATPRCSGADFLHFNQNTWIPACSNSTAVGVTAVKLAFPGTIATTGAEYYDAPVYNLVPAPGTAAKLGFIALGVPVTIDVRVNQLPPYNIVATLQNIAQPVPFYGGILSVWGNPANEAHDSLRGSCVNNHTPSKEPIFRSIGTCTTDIAEKPFLTLPRACTGPLASGYQADSWQQPGVFTPPASSPTTGMSGCSKLGFSPTIAARPTSSSAESSSGLNVDLSVHDEGLTSPTGLAQSDIKKVVLTLPEGVTVNPSAAEGLGACTKADFERESLNSLPGEGCPGSSKLGTVKVETPLLENEPLEGAVFIAQPDDPATTEPGAENPFDSLLAGYMVIRNAQLGIIVKQAGKIELNDRTGQLVSTFDDIPQLPFSNLQVRFREGPRAPLVTPSACGTYTSVAQMTPWADPEHPITTTSSFEVTSGVGGGPCPGSTRPFKPSFTGGTINNDAGSYSPLYMRVTRSDGEQELTRLDSLLPPGLTGKVAGIPKCSDAAIAAAKGKTGKQELASPSCPESSLVGHIQAGAGVGSSLTYVPGNVYLAGAFGGDPLSVVVLTPAVTGPFDVGTVVTREGLALDANTAEVQIDGSHAEPLPTILKGIPLRLRDLRINSDRANFTLNPTSCSPFSLRGTLFGTGSAVASPSSRFQASNCARLNFKPGLSLKLKGGTKRGAHPALTGVVRYPRGSGYANVGKVVVTLPHSAFLEQAHIRTVCTRVQFAADQCPAGSIYGKAKATTPLLDEPLEGPVYLRSSSHPLPDLVIALHGLFDINVVGRIDSTNARLRTSFESVPDAPVSSFTLQMQGGKKGLIVNSRNLCAHQSRAVANFTGQNGKLEQLKPVVVASSCSGKKAKKK